MQIPYPVSSDISTYMELVEKNSGSFLIIQSNVRFVAEEIVLFELDFTIEKR